ncbi:MAG: hypothetical protein K2X26_00965 [Chitinophagaceae bacterium]|nr:hypothetical protein [Chitinophagaceae bacterium]
MELAASEPWGNMKKIFFRFFFLICVLFITPFSFLQSIPVIDSILGYYFNAYEAICLQFNKWIFYIVPNTKVPNGNGDYPEQWMTLYTSLLLALIGCIIWSIIDRKRKEYTKLNYWLFLAIRYFVISNGFSYGIFKLFAVQMPFPNLSQLATPLGDFLPMRLSWMFIGYSHSYQVFSGFIEVLAALLLLFRPTATLGILVSLGVFGNVMMLNLSYDIPVKINSITLVILCLWLLTEEMPRLFQFFFFNRALPSKMLVFPFSTKRGRIIARLTKWIMVLFWIAVPTTLAIQTLEKRGKDLVSAAIIPVGYYDVLVHAKGKDTITIAGGDSTYWQNIVIDNISGGSIKSVDSRFRLRYGRAYFNYKIDTVHQHISLFKSTADSIPIVQFHFQIKDPETIIFSSTDNKEAIYLLLRRRQKPFPLAEKQFHWISETNR